MVRALVDDHRFRFAAVGLSMTLLHLLVFHLVTPPLVAEAGNAVAFVVVTQVNFLVSYHWTWAARRPAGREPLRRVLHRALLFNGSVTVAFLANSAAFWAAHRLVGAGPTASVLLATVVSAAVAYLVSSRVVFARVPVPLAPVPALSPATPSPH